MVEGVLAYLILPRPFGPKPFSYHESSQCIKRGGRKTSESDEELLSRIYSCWPWTREDLNPQDLCEKLPFHFEEEEVYDTINPFGDFRQIDYRSLWTVDITQDSLLYTNRYQHCDMKLSTLRERVPSFSDFQPLSTVQSSSQLDVFHPSKPYWRPDICIDDRIRAFTYRMLRDFHHQWRHILRNDYNFTTFKVFAQALIWLSALQFDVCEVTESRHGVWGDRVWITELPKWKPLTSNIVLMGGGAHIVFCRSLQQGLTTAQTDLASIATQNHSAANGIPGQRVYLVWAFKHVVLCRGRKGGDLETTATEVILYGGKEWSPSNLALDYLLFVTTAARPLISTRIQSLPIEIQDKILREVSAGLVISAKLGCILGIGSRFLWKDGQTYIHLEETEKNRTPDLPVESHIWFKRHKSGLVYRARS